MYGFLAAEHGFEPRQTDSETVVLPLHNSAMSRMERVLFYQRFYDLSIAFPKKLRIFMTKKNIRGFSPDVFPRPARHAAAARPKNGGYARLLKVVLLVSLDHLLHRDTRTTSTPCIELFKPFFGAFARKYLNFKLRCIIIG